MNSGIKMKIKIILKGEKDLLYPFNYNGEVKKLICNIAQDYDKKFNFFTFSNLIMNDYVVNDTGLFSKSDEVSFYLSSPDDFFISCVVNGLCCSEDIQLCNNMLNVDKIEFIECPNFSQDSIFTFKTLSPILIRSTKEINGQYRQIDLSPYDDLFLARLEDNLKSKYCNFNNLKKCEKSLKILKCNNVKSKRISTLNNGHCIFNRVYFVNLNVIGDNDLLNFAWNAGFGERNNLGFGMIE